MRGVELGWAGLNPGVGGLPLKGWPLTGIDQIRPSLGAQVQKPFLQNANQLHLLPQQQLLAQVQAQGNLGSSPIYGDMDPQRFRGLSRGTLNAKDGQLIANDGSLGSPMQSTSSKGRSNKASLFVDIAVYYDGPCHGCVMILASSNHFGWCLFTKELDRFLSGENTILVEGMTSDGAVGGGLTDSSGQNGKKTFNYDN
nr:transcriptional corepressor [Quercus suber]